ncbi:MULTISPECIES: histidine kinase [unclassified Phenylobacterium]|uniref:histidine kinase n=1 Tax=unclassified Phenylobacterium TaxID=2640670 RepID=UPI0009E9E081|nr:MULTISPECIES: histidine kinase [unclassified Phenylobacterium]
MALPQNDAAAAALQRPRARDKIRAGVALAELRNGQAQLISANPDFRQSAGMAGASARGRRLSEVFGDADGRRLQSLIEDCVQAGRAGRIEHVRRTADCPEGRRVWAHPVEWAEDGVEQVILTIAPPGRSHQLTTHSETLFDHLGPISTGMLYVYDVGQRRTRYIHPELAESLGLSPAGAGLGDVQHRLHPSDLPVLERHLSEMAMLGNQQVTEAQFRMRGKDGNWITVRSRARVFSRTPDGGVRRVIGVASDVTAAEVQAIELAKAREDIIRAEQDERRRIGRELHDSTAQHLVAIGLSLKALERRVVFDESHQDILRDIRNSIAAAHAEIRSFSFMLHPPKEEQRDLIDKLRGFADGFGRRASLRISVDMVGEPKQTSPAMETALFRIFQEALMNVHRHTTAHKVHAVLDYAGAQISLMVEDDGGKPKSGRLPSADDDTGVGISGMRGRLIELGGRLDLEPGKGGLRVRAQLPLQRQPGKVADQLSTYLGRLVAPEERSFAPRRRLVDRSPPPLA